MKCKECNTPGCVYRTSNAEEECYYTRYSERPYILVDNGKSDVKVMLSPKAQWISETVVKLISDIPYEYVCSGVGGQTMEPRHLYAARIAKEMADVIFDK